MKKIFLFFAFFSLLLNSMAQNYTFSNTMSRDVLENYLSRSITMQGLTDANSCYSSQCNAPTTYDPIGYTEDIAMLKNINARFIGRSAGLWGGEWVINNGYFNKVGQMVTDITSGYNSVGLIKPVIQAAIFEFVSNNVNGISISSQVASTYGVAQRPFNMSLMTYSDYPSNANHQTIWGSSNEIVPDMSKQETQMWFYFMATQYIDRGIEAIHFGQVEIMDDFDPNHTAWWDLLSKIRVYAASKNRGVILCDAHTSGLYLNSTNQLLFDFHSYPLRISESLPSWGSNNGGPAILDYNYCGAIYGHSKGGQTFFGWNAAHLPYLVEFDNYGISNNPNKTGTGCFPWGWDEITWFGLQSENYRNKY